MEHGTIVAWFKREGDSFTVGEPLYEVESEKANIEIEAKLPGTLARIVAGEGFLSFGIVEVHCLGSNMPGCVQVGRTS